MIGALVLLVASFLALPAHAQEPSALDAAYQKEFAYLVAEKRSLETRLAEVRSTTGSQLASSEAELERLEARQIRTDLDVERIEGTLEGIEREVDGMNEASDALESTLVAARSSLERDGFAIGEPAEDFGGRVDQLGKAYTEGVARIEEGRTVRTSDGTFFLGDGTKVDGTVTRVGNIAAYGVADRGAGALVPAGDGKLRIWSEPANDAAKAVAGGSASGSLPVYLFENLDKRIDDEPEGGLWAKLEAGGIVGLVIVFLGLIAAVLVVIRGLTLTAIGRGGDALAHAVSAAVEAGDLERANKLAKGSDSMARVIHTILPHIDDGRKKLENTATEAMLREQPRLERFSTAIMVIAAVAPLLGLLGTVTGMISTFDIITRFGTGDPKMLSSGISEALVTTQLGLVVAIPALLLGNLLTAWSTSVMDSVERGAMHLVNLAAARRKAEPELTEGPEDNVREVPRAAHG